MRQTFVIDWGLVPISVLSVATGIGLQIAGQGVNHAIWDAWAAAHICSSLLFAILAFAHIRAHWGWYVGWFKNGLGRGKSRVTAAVSLLFIMLVVTGAVLLGVEGANSGIGLWHYRIGLAATALFAWHTVKRFAILRNMGRRR